MTRLRISRAAILIAIFALPFAANAQVSKTVALLKGEVTGEDGAHVPDLNVAIFKGVEKVVTTRTNIDGKFTAILQPNTTYRVGISGNTFLYKEETVNVPALEKYLEIPFKTEVRALKNGQKFDISVQVFKPKSKAIDEAAVAQLEDVVQILKKNPKLTLAITVYPDATIKSAKDAEQKQLVSSRANAFSSFFTTRGVAAKSVEIIQSDVVPADGKFAQTVTEKVKKKTVTRTVMIPQYVVIEAKVMG